MSTRMELGGQSDLGTFLQEQQDALMRKWLAGGVPLASRTGLPSSAFCECIPTLVQTIVELTRQLERRGRLPHPAELWNGPSFARLRSACDPGLLVGELSALREAIWRHLAESRVEVSAREAQRLDAAIDRVVQAAVHALTEKTLRTQQVLDEISAATFEDGLDLDALLDRLLKVLRSTVRTADTATFLLLEGEELRVAASLGLEEEVESGVRVPLGKGFAGRIASTRQPLALSDVERDPGEFSRVLRAKRLRALYGVPLVASGRLLGVLHVGSLSRPEFSESDRSFVGSVAERAALAIGHRTLLQELERHAEALRRNEARYRLLATASAQTVWTTDPDGTAHESSSWQAFTGQSADETRGTGWLDAVHPEDRARVDHVFADARSTRRVYETEFRVRRPSGDYSWVHSRGVPVLDRAGNVLEWLGTTSLIDAQKQAEEAARARAQQQKALLELGQRALEGELADLLEATPRCVAEALKVDLSVVFEVEPESQTLVPRTGAGFDDKAFDPQHPHRMPHEGSLAGYVLTHRVPVRVEDFAKETRFRPIQLVASAGARSAMAVVIETNVRPGQAYGVLGAYSRTLRRFSAEEQRFLQAVANVLAAAIAREREAASRRRAETAQRESRARLNAFLDHSPAFIYAKDLEGRYTLCNRRFASLGQPPEFRLGKTDEELFDAAGAHMLRSADQAVLERGEAQEVEERVTLHGGDVRTFLSVKFPIFDDRGNIQGVGGISTDITERTRTLERLHESEERMRILVEQIRDYAIIMLDPGGKVTTWNAGAERLLGYTANEITGVHFSRFYPSPERERGLPEKLLAEARETGRSEDEGWRQRRDGSLYWANVIVTALRDPLGTLLGFVEVVRDFTERRRYEENLRLLADASQILASTRDLQDSLQQVADLLVPSLSGWCSFDLLRPDGTVQDYVAVAGSNRPGTRQVLEYRRRNPVKLTDPRGLAWVLRTGRSIFLPRADETDLEPFVRSREHVRLSRAIGLRSLLIVPITWQEQTYGAIVLAAGPDDRRFDATDLAVAEDLGRRVALAVANARLVEELQHAVRLREDILAVVSHDLKSPLSAIALSTTLLQRRGRQLPGWEQQRRQLETIERSTRRMDRLIRDLLDMASIRAGRLSLAVRPEPVASLVEEAIEQHAVAALEREIALVPLLPPEELWVRGDRERILQVLGNLVGNALKFSNSGDSVTLRVTASPAEVVFSVIDTGPGIRPEDHERIFEPYWSGRENSQRGTGLGLFISKGLVEAQGGRIWLESASGKGSAFHFTLPRETRPESRLEA